MKKRYAFTLVEVLVATMIFTFVSLSMMSVYFAANRHVLQNYRADKLKADLATAMRAITTVAAQATRIDSPAANAETNDLILATNIESGATPCYPMVTSTNDAAAPTPTWYRFCWKQYVAPRDTNNGDLYFHYGTITGSVACPNSTGAGFTNPGSGFTCGSGNNAMLLATEVTRTTNLFSRKIHTATDAKPTRLMNNSTVRVYLNSKWNTGGTFNATQNPVDYTLEGYFTVVQPR